VFSGFTVHPDRSASVQDVLWVVRECVSGEIMLARLMLSAATEDFAGGGAGWAKRWRG